MIIKCLDCEHFFESFNVLCCNKHRVGLKYDRNRTMVLAELSKRCQGKEDAPSEFIGTVTEEHINKFEEIYKDTSKSVKELMKEHKIHPVKWTIMAHEINRRTGYKRPRHDSTKIDRYISRRRGAKQDYFIIKHSNKYYGSYTSLERARFARNLLETYEWDKKFLPYIKKRTDDYYDNLECK